MKLPIIELKEELTKRKKELENHLTLRLHDIFYWVIHEEFKDEKNIHIFDLIVRIILQADKCPTESIADLMTLATPERCYEVLDRWTLSNSAAFIRDYLKKDQIHYILERRRERLAI
ncbi:MAG: hypothetical protein OXB84_03680 [Halobacteriovoraceae bacterium]|nr:hypothetical protein [Halobacteriovoraceae bacterium]